MSAADIGEKFGQQIAAGLGPVDQVMMRVDDRQFGLDDLLATPSSQSCRTGRCTLVAAPGVALCIRSLPLLRLSMMVFDK